LLLLDEAHAFELTFWCGTCPVLSLDASLATPEQTARVPGLRDGSGLPPTG
jgi:hypothetical protein